MSGWFTAHKDGLRQIAERLVEARGFGIIGGELYQNVSDTNATECRINISKEPGQRLAALRVEDNDPEGFPDLSHAYTMFAPSFKKGDPTKAGRFNVGEKMVLAFCRDAQIATTKGTVHFDSTGRNEYPRRKRDRGTVFTASIECSGDRLKQFLDYMNRIIVRPGLTLIVNGEIIFRREPLLTISAKLPTEVADEDGNMRRSIRVCDVELYEPKSGEVPMLYELGIPVVETGDKWHYNVLQKVPLNVERDNVTPAYLRDLRTFVFNHTYNRIEGDDTTTTWVNEAASDNKCIPAAIEQFRVQKFGEKSVAFDPGNPEANAEAAAHGYVVIPSRGLTPGQRENLKVNNFLLSASAAFPTAGRGAYSDDPNAPVVEVVPEDQLTPEMVRICAYTTELARRLIGKRIEVRIVKGPRIGTMGGTWDACYGRGHCLGTSHFDYNLNTLGKGWFNEVTEVVDDLILHELAHEYESNHLSEKYYRGLSKLGARLKAEVLKNVGWFLNFGASPIDPVTTATETCWSALRSLPADQAKTVLRELGNLLSGSVALKELHKRLKTTPGEAAAD